MGRVFLAQSAGGRPVAVKVIRPDLAADPEFRARFRHEVAAARIVNGLYTALVVDADVDGPTPWLATAYVAGPSLADKVRLGGPLPADAVALLAAGLAEGLGAIHASGLVHRDLKPSNVLLADDGPRVIDFGISRAVEASALTSTGLVVGSPGFMSPEQATGGEVGPPSDVFSLGAVLTFASTGRGPFGTGSAPALGYRVVHAAPDLTDVPTRIRSVVERCLAKQPAERPTIAELLAVFGDPEVPGDWLSPARPDQLASDARDGAQDVPARAWTPTVEAQPHPAFEITESRIAEVSPAPAAAVPSQHALAATRPRTVTFRQRTRVILAVGLSAAIGASVLAILLSSNPSATHPPDTASSHPPPTDTKSSIPTQSVSPGPHPIAALTDPGAGGVGGVGAVAFNPSGTTLAAASSGSGSIYVWNTTTRKITATLTNRAGNGTQSVAFSPDGSTLAAGDTNGEIYLWNAITHKAVATLTGPGSTGTVPVAFSPDGATLAANNYGGGIYIWSLATDTITATIGSIFGGSAVAFSPNGTTLASDDYSGDIYIWSLATKALIKTLSDSEEGQVNSVAFSPSGTILAIGYGGGTTKLWNVATGKVTTTLTAPGSDSLNSVAFSPNGATLAIGYGGGTTKLWNVATGKVTTTLTDPGGIGSSVTSLAFNPKGTMLATGDGDGSTYLWTLLPYAS